MPRSISDFSILGEEEDEAQTEAVSISPLLDGCSDADLDAWVEESIASVEESITSVEESIASVEESVASVGEWDAIFEKSNFLLRPDRLVNLFGGDLRM
jgi:hypothetical protein